MHAHRKLAQQARSVTIPDVPSLEECLEAAALFQSQHCSKYAGKSPKQVARLFRFTAVLHRGDIHDPHYRVMEKTPELAIQKAIQHVTESKPNGRLSLIVYYKLPSCSFFASIFCVHGEELLRRVYQGTSIVYR